MLDERTSAKITVLGSDYQTHLLELVDEENLPTFMGGSSKCSENSDIGPWNDGSVDGYPQPFWEGFDSRDNNKRGNLV